MFHVTKDHRNHFICVTVSFSIISQTPAKTHLFPSSIVKTEEKSECGSHAVYKISDGRRSVRQIEERNSELLMLLLKMMLPLALVQFWSLSLSSSPHHLSKEPSCRSCAVCWCETLPPAASLPDLRSSLYSIASRYFQVPSYFCYGRPRCHLNFPCLYALLAATSWAVKAAGCPSLSFGRQGCFLSNSFCSQLPAKLLWI